MTEARTIAAGIAALLATASLAYTLLSLVFVGRLLRRDRASPRQPDKARTMGRVAFLKPLFGREPNLTSDLLSFLREARDGRAAVVMGVASPDDLALAAAREALRREGATTARIVVGGGARGANGKIANVLNIEVGVDADVVVLSDSDIFAPEGYLDAVLEALDDPGVGAVTCPYYGRAAAGFWSRLAAMGLSYQFLPSVAAGVGLGLAHPCMGSTIALKAKVLEAIGGFAAFKDTLADDYAMGAAVRAQGLQVRVVPLAVGHSCAEATLGELFRHELRWSRTIRGVDPAGHAGSLLTHPTPLSLAVLAVAGPGLAPAALLAAAIIARFAVKIRVDRLVEAPVGGFWLLPVRDIVSFLVFIGSFLGRAVEWRGSRFHVTSRGDLRPI